MGRGGRYHRYEAEPADHDECDAEHTKEEAVAKASVRLGMWDFAQCDPKRCSGRRLCRLKVIEEFRLNTRFKGIILT